MKNALVVAILLASSTAVADISKDECLDAHSRGQDAKEQGKLSLARKLFMTCAQSACPSLVQGDCARFADDLSRLQPSLSFVARDASGADLPDTTVYVDDVLVVTRLDDGKPHDIDPGKHTIKFTNEGHEQTVTVVVGAGEKGRTINVTFGSPAGAPAAAGAAPAVAVKKGPTVTHPAGARYLMWGGGVAAVGGAALVVVGLLRMPSNCSISSSQCAAPPGDPTFDKASSAMSMANYGWILGSAGVAAVVGGTIWYYKGSKTTKESSTALVSPWVSPTGAGLALSGQL
ncbi:MAG TPA: hypothetical protein VGO00_29750 [Kofleriaceae bacterium]|jgi:hypothetical protein|nr:hypothetical protein [Kofleriaceae bacterium]